jgi:hypothetical protein
LPPLRQQALGARQLLAALQVPAGQLVQPVLEVQPGRAAQLRLRKAQETESREDHCRPA